MSEQPARAGWYALDLAIAVCAGLVIGLAVAMLTKREPATPPESPAAD
jgi:hypothetical protein